MSNTTNKESTPCNRLWLNSNNNVPNYYNDNNLLYFDDAARKRSYLVFVLQCSKLFAPETLKESSTSQQNFFWSCSLSLPTIMFSWHAEMNYIDRKKLHFEEEKIE